MTEILEIIMIICFGVSWPFNLMKSIKTKSTKGKSFVFLACIALGYVAGIISKFLNDSYMANFSSKWYVLIFYFINLSMVVADIILFIIHYNQEKKQQI